MRQKLLAIAMVCLLMSSCRAQNDTGSAASDVSALEHLWKQAEEKGDIQALDPILDDGITYVDEDGAVLTKAQFLSHAKQASGRQQSLVMQTISVNVYYGELAVAVGSYRAKAEEGGKNYRRQVWFVDTWVLKKGKWVCVVAQATPILR